MSVDGFLRAKAGIVAVLDHHAPDPRTMEEFQLRQAALVDALADDFATWLVWRNPGSHLPAEFVVQQAASFSADILIPFILASVKALHEAQGTRH